ncbi:hypothetical protein CYMTET_28693, partial [Cymbomonas tetramitiformis]
VIHHLDSAARNYAGVCAGFPCHAGALRLLDAHGMTPLEVFLLQQPAPRPAAFVDLLRAYEAELAARCEACDVHAAAQMLGVLAQCLPLVVQLGLPLDAVWPCFERHAVIRVGAAGAAASAAPPSAWSRLPSWLDPFSGVAALLASYCSPAAPPIESVARKKCSEQGIATPSSGTPRGALPAAGDMEGHTMLLMNVPGLFAPFQHLPLAQGGPAPASGNMSASAPRPPCWVELCQRAASGGGAGGSRPRTPWEFVATHLHADRFDMPMTRAAVLMRQRAAAWAPVSLVALHAAFLVLHGVLLLGHHGPQGEDAWAGEVGTGEAWTLGLLSALAGLYLLMEARRAALRVSLVAYLSEVWSWIALLLVGATWTLLALRVGGASEGIPGALAAAGVLGWVYLLGLLRIFPACASVVNILLLAMTRTRCFMLVLVILSVAAGAGTHALAADVWQHSLRRQALMMFADIGAFDLATVEGSDEEGSSLLDEEGEGSLPAVEYVIVVGVAVLYLYIVGVIMLNVLIAVVIEIYNAARYDELRAMTPFRAALDLELSRVYVPLLPESCRMRAPTDPNERLYLWVSKESAAAWLPGREASISGRTQPVYRELRRVRQDLRGDVQEVRREVQGLRQMRKDLLEEMDEMRMKLELSIRPSYVAIQQVHQLLSQRAQGELEREAERQTRMDQLAGEAKQVKKELQLEMQQLRSGVDTAVQARLAGISKELHQSLEAADKKVDAKLDFLIEQVTSIALCVEQARTLAFSQKYANGFAIAEEFRLCSLVDTPEQEKRLKQAVKAVALRQGTLAFAKIGKRRRKVPRPSVPRTANPAPARPGFVQLDSRTCFNCGRVVHISADFPDARAAAAVGGNPRRR